jgi:hypothetical protein
MRVAKGVDTHDRQLAGVLEHFIMHGLVLEAAALVPEVAQAECMSKANQDSRG